MEFRIGLTLDCAHPEELAQFWQQALGYIELERPETGTSGSVWLRDPTGTGPLLVLMKVPEPKVVKNRCHIDLDVGPDGGPEEHWARVLTATKRLHAAGATVIREITGRHVTMADPEGNEFCVC